MPVEFLLDHFLQRVQQPGVGPAGRAAKVRGGDRHGYSWGTHDTGKVTGERFAGTYGIVGYESVGYEAVG
ncbi:hypothetical protein GCM10022233_33440 [Streptomyces shaanxiensis]|uniref:Uncharacterized protein n=1 Tax=Streptomyces shaanxiensis TaxID=653357 RepID=A0ABP7V375_9ACTN